MTDRDEVVAVLADGPYGRTAHVADGGDHKIMVESGATITPLVPQSLLLAAREELKAVCKAHFDAGMRAAKAEAELAECRRLLRNCSPWVGRYLPASEMNALKAAIARPDAAIDACVGGEG